MIADSNQSILPDHFEDAVGDDKHLAGHFASPANHVARSEDGRAHFEHQVVQEFRLALFKDAHLQNDTKIFI